MTLTDYEIEVGKHVPTDRQHLVMKLSPAHYEEFVILMLEKYGPADRRGLMTVTHCMDVPVIEDAGVKGIAIVRRAASKM